MTIKQLRQSIRRLILEVNDWQCNKHSLGWIDNDGTWIDCRGGSHGEWLYRHYYNEVVPPEGITIPKNWIKVSNANNIFFCGERFEDITPSQIQGLIQMWGDCSRYSRWIQNQTETFYVVFGLIEPDEMKEDLTYMEEMTIPEFLDQYGGRDSIDDFYGMLLGESIERLVEADGFQCNSHSLGFVDDQGNWLDTEGADHQDYLWANVYGMEDNRPGGYPMPDGWIKVSNASQIFFGGNSWDEVTPEQIDGLIDMWNACSKYSKWIKREPETFQVIFGLISNKRRMSNLEEMTIPEFLKRYGGRHSVDTFYGMLLGEL